jgi:IS5 family transposase
LIFCVTGAHRHDSVVFEALVDAIPKAAGKAGKLHADKGYDAKRCHAHLKRRRIKDRIARKGIERNDRLGKHRWVVERSHAWLSGYGKLRIRFERAVLTHVALLSLACCITCIRALL